MKFLLDQKNIRKIFSISFKKFSLKIYYFPMGYLLVMVNILYEGNKLMIINKIKYSQYDLPYKMYK